MTFSKIPWQIPTATPCAEGCSTPVFEVPTPKLFVNIRGAAAKDSPFGILSIEINSPDDIQTDSATGNLIIQSAGGRRRHPRTGEMRTYPPSTMCINARSWDRIDLKSVIR